jgi:hypothetical protein
MRQSRPRNRFERRRRQRSHRQLDLRRQVARRRVQAETLALFSNKREVALLAREGFSRFAEFCKTSAYVFDGKH